MRATSHTVRCYVLLVVLYSAMNSVVVGATDTGLLVEQLKKFAASEAGWSEKEPIAKQFWDIGAPAIPYLLPLLSDGNEKVRAFASDILSRIEGLTEEHLDALIASRRRGDDGIPPAIARIGSPKAVEFLVDELVREREFHTQLTFAIEILGSKAVPSLVRIYQSNPGWDERLEQTMLFVFNELGDKAVGAIPPLLKIATDRKANTQNRIQAIAALGAIGTPAESVVPTLLQLHKTGPKKMRGACIGAIRGIGSPAATPFLVQQLREETQGFQKEWLIWEIAKLRTGGVEAGPILVEYLGQSDWRLRIAAARALGFIEYSGATEKLIGLLDCEDDWRAVYCAAESLGRLGASRAAPALMRVSENHWYSPVRKAAGQAVQAVRDKTPSKSGSDGGNSGINFFSYEDVGPDEKPFSWKEADSNSIRFPVASLSSEPVEVPIKQMNGGVRRVTLPGLPVEGGHLVAWDRGEFGGFVGFIDPKGTLKVLAAENTEAVYPGNQEAYAICGLAHGFINEGAIYKIQRAPNGHWVARKWRALPGAPRFSRLLKDGNLFINCTRGIVLVSPDGKMKSLTRAEVL